MTFPEFEQLRLLPRVTWFERLFGNVPVPPGFYGAFWDGVLCVTSNNAAELNSLSNQKPVTFLALPGGGFPLRAALALKRLHLIDLQRALQTLPPSEKPTRLLIPGSLAESFGLRPDAQIDEIPIEIQPDFHPTSPFLETLLVSLRILPAQAISLSIPLLLFGITAWVWGVTSLVIAALMVGILWNYIPLPAPFRGFLVALLMGGVVWGFQPDFVLQNWRLLFGVALAPLWYGILLSGTQP